MNPNILIIDDDTFTRQVLCKILRRDRSISRYRPNIIEATNGTEGLQLFEKHKPTLVIVDLLMPRIDGFEVCKRIREQGCDKTIIAVTSGVYKDVTIAKQIHEDYNAEFFAKPYQIKKIAEFVARALSPNPGSPRAPAPSSQDPETLSGSLKKRNAAKVFLDLLQDEKTGRLVLRRGQVVRQIELYVGHPVSVTTNVREETLGHFLVSKKKIDSETHSFAMKLAAKDKVRLGEALISLGAISPTDLLNELTAQTRFKLVNALRWRDGTWTFRRGAAHSSHGDALNLVEVIVGGLAATAQLEPPPPRITALFGKKLSLNTRGRKLLAQIAASISPNFASCFGANTTLDKLEASGVNRVHILSCLDVLLECGGLVSTELPGAAQLVVGDNSGPIDLQEIANSKSLQDAPDLMASLFDSGASQSTRTGENPLTALGTKDLWSTVTASETATAEADANAEDTGPEEGRRKRRSSMVQAQALTDDELIEPPERAEEDEQIRLARSAILEEFLRIQAKNLYEVLVLTKESTKDEIREACKECKANFAKARFEDMDLNRDFQKLDVLHATYEQCEAVLLDDTKRADYDHSLEGQGIDLSDVPSLDAEIEFREAERMLAEGNGTQAIAKFRSAVNISPKETAYQAELGWALYLYGGKTPEAADKARTYINNALAMSSDDVLANEYKGLIHAHLGDDIESALLHLEKALAGDPRRVEAVRTIERIRIERNEFRPLEKLYRRLLFRLKGSSAGEEAMIWSRLGDLHRHYLRDLDSALIAYQAAGKLTPLDETLQAKILDITSGDRAQLYARSKQLCEQWQAAPADTEPLNELFRFAQELQHSDAAFLAASSLRALGHQSDEAASCYHRYRPRFLLRAQQQLGADLWPKLLFEGDYPLLGALYALLAPSIQSIAPGTDAEAEVAQADAMDESALLSDFRKVRDYVAHVLDVPTPAIYSRSDYGRSVHVATQEQPILLAGYELLTCNDKLELAFRLGRAMSYLRPGRALVAGCPSAILKSAMLACYALRSPEATIPDPDGTVGQFKQALHAGTPRVRDQVTELVSHISQEHPSLNLSRWVRDLNRSADRVGLLLCGDLPTSLRCMTELGDQDSSVHLIHFANSRKHIQLRADIGLSINV